MNLGIFGFQGGSGSGGGSAKGAIHGTPITFIVGGGGSYDPAPASTIYANPSFDWSKVKAVQLYLDGILQNYVEGDTAVSWWQPTADGIEMINGFTFGGAGQFGAIYYAFI